MMRLLLKEKGKRAEETKPFAALVPGSTGFNRDARGALGCLLKGAPCHTNTPPQKIAEVDFRRVRGQR